MTCTKEWPAFKERTLALAERLERVLKKEDATRKSVMAFNMTMFITNRLEPRRCGRLESLSWLVRGRVEWFRPLV